MTIGYKSNISNIPVYKPANTRLVWDFIFLLAILVVGIDDNVKSCYEAFLLLPVLETSPWESVKYICIRNVPLQNYTGDRGEATARTNFYKTIILA